MGLVDIIEKVINIVNNDTTLVGVYFGDQMGYSNYPVACVGAPSLLDENFPVIAGQAIHDEKYTVEIVIYQKFEDTEANAKSIITLTDTMRAALRADMKPPLQPLGGYVYQADIGNTRFVWGSKGEILFRISVTTVNYIKRIS